MRFYLALSLLMIAHISEAQDSLEFEDTPNEKIVSSAFNGSTIVNTQSTNVVSKGQLNFLIAHRFGSVKEGAFNLFGLDYSVIRLGFEYGVTKNLTLGIGRFSYNKNYDGFLKYRLLTQKQHAPSGNSPISLTWFSSAAFSSVALRAQNQLYGESQFIKNLVYTFQALISREFSSAFSVQLTPTMIHRNRVSNETYKNNLFSIGSAARVRITKSLHLNIDYHYLVNKDEAVEVYDPLGIGIDIVTGGHVFKLHFTNSDGIIEKEFIPNTRDDFFKGNIHFGFTVLRSFMIRPEVKGGKIY